MSFLAENFLDAWINFSTVLKNNRYMINMSFNEGLICHILYKEKNLNGNILGLPIKDICSKTNMLKSQVNKVINGMERKNIILKNKINEDRRLVFISLSENGLKVYQKEYRIVLENIKRLVNVLGKEKAKSAINIFYEITRDVELLNGGKYEHKNTN